MVTHRKADEVWGLHSAMLSPPSPLKLYIVTRHKVMFSSPTLARLLSHCQQVNLPLGGRPSGLHLFFKLKYSQFTMLYQFLVYIKVIQLYSQITQWAPRDTRRYSGGERCPLLPLEMRPDYEGESGMQPWIPVAPGEEP